MTLTNLYYDGLKVHIWSMFSRPMHGPGSQVCLTFCFPLFCKLELSGDMLYLLSIWPPSPNCALEIYWIRHHLPCKNGKMWVLQQFNFTLSFSFNFKICLYKLRKANRCVLSFFFVWGVKFGNQVCIDPSACLTS